MKVDMYVALSLARATGRNIGAIERFGFCFRRHRAEINHGLSHRVHDFFFCIGRLTLARSGGGAIFLHCSAVIEDMLKRVFSRHVQGIVQLAKLRSGKKWFGWTHR